MRNDSAPTLNEMLAVCLCKELKDGEVGFTGLGTGSYASKFVTSIPWAAMELARRTHAPNLTIMMAGWKVNPDISRMRKLPHGEFDTWLRDVPCDAHSKGFPVHLWRVKRGDVGFSFCSGVQVDAQGNVNSVLVGDPKNPKVRLIGPVLQPEHLSLFKREFIMMPYHEPRRFVEKVDFVSGVGYPGGLAGRRELGLESGGPELIFSPKCIFDFDKERGRAKLRSIHPGVTLDEVRANTGFDLGDVSGALETPLPDPEYLRVLREEVDPHGIFL